MHEHKERDLDTHTPSLMVRYLVCGQRAETECDLRAEKQVEAWARRWFVFFPAALGLCGLPCTERVPCQVS